jgi:hypothetical protein
MRDLHSSKPSRRSLVCGVTVAIALCACSDALATSNACWNNADVVKATHHISIARGRREAFIEYVRKEIPNNKLSLSEVSGDGDISLILQNTDNGILAITIRNKMPSQRFDMIVKSCDFASDWRPYWRYVLRKVRNFPQPTGSFVER